MGIAEDTDDIGKAKLTSFFESFNEELDKGKENEENEKTPQNDQADEKKRVFQESANTISWVKFGYANRHLHLRVALKRGMLPPLIPLFIKIASENPFLCPPAGRQGRG
jgi:hypothetical protein